jgi:O-antigen/teichoic acid export membrane protein
MLTETTGSPRASGRSWAAVRHFLRYTLPHSVGLDRAIAFTVLGRVVSGLGSVVSVLLIVHFLSATQQGYYYTLWSLVALQSVFELGFSFVILQVAAHERAHLEFHPDGSITGSEAAHLRLASLLQRAVRWYSIAAVVMGIVLLVGGMRFFAMHQEPQAPGMWVAPLRVTVLACAITFSIGPVLSFLEGCGQVAQVARMRFFQSAVSVAASWTAMLSHHGLFSPAMVLLGQGLVASILLYSRRRLLLPLLRMNVAHGGINWRSEVWPFQWKIAVSWLCDYFVFQLFTPVLFAFRGPVEAGKMGLSMSIVLQMSAMMLAWMTTKAAPFGSLIAKKQTPELDRMFFRSLRQSISLFAGGAFLVLTGVLIAPYVMPKISGRIEGWPIFLLLLLTALSSHVVQSEAIYLRAHKCEPFLVQSIVIAFCTAGSVIIFAKSSGAWGVSLAYFVVLGLAGVVSATAIFKTKRREWAEAEV